jgi:metal-responsive CopG/Arc/MetJ family transcriptional regulator
VATSKIAITMPEPLLERVNQWSEKLAQSRSQFIAEQMEKRLQELEEEEVRHAYNQAYKDEQTLAENRALAEELLRSAPQANEDEAW